MQRTRTGQSTVEYAVLAAVVVGALLAMQIYMKRGTMGKLREGSDQIGEQFTPSNTNSEFTTTYDVRREDTLLDSGANTSTLVTQNEVRDKTGEEHVGEIGGERLFKK